MTVHSNQLNTVTLTPNFHTIITIQRSAMFALPSEGGAKLGG